MVVRIMAKILLSKNTFFTGSNVQIQSRTDILDFKVDNQNKKKSIISLKIICFIIFLLSFHR